eukprot:gnl/Dysnectes_brevis/6467_a10050_495.p1 GENE.gnl/Dysnectes_brevis/6467_a10050_495~~gnl/Dysnectes_brevis/6467_a10050_495.p1  ORF type:complete len:259 (-),score=24.44 gnl/Dysnectes_brevis/6467_a10050_495:44-820(-)
MSQEDPFSISAVLFNFIQLVQSFQDTEVKVDPQTQQEMTLLIETALMTLEIEAQERQALIQHHTTLLSSLQAELPSDKTVEDVESQAAHAYEGMNSALKLKIEHDTIEHTIARMKAHQEQYKKNRIEIQKVELERRNVGAKHASARRAMHMAAKDMVDAIKRSLGPRMEVLGFIRLITEKDTAQLLEPPSRSSSTHSHTPRRVQGGMHGDRRYAPRPRMRQPDLRGYSDRGGRRSEDHRGYRDTGRLGGYRGSSASHK